MSGGSTEGEGTDGGEAVEEGEGEDEEEEVREKHQK